MFAKLARIFSVILLLAVAVSAQATTYTTWTATPAADPVYSGAGLASTSLQDLASPSELIVAMPYRTDVLIYNQAGDAVYVNVGGSTASSTTTSCIKVPAGGSLALEVDEDVTISACSAATSTIAIVQTVKP